MSDKQSKHPETLSDAVGPDLAQWPTPPPPESRADSVDRSAPQPRAAASEAHILGKALATLRSLRGLKQRDLASIAGTSVGVISQYERGHRSPGFLAVLNVVTAMGFTLSDLDWARTIVSQPGTPDLATHGGSQLILKLDIAPLLQLISTTVAQTCSLYDNKAAGGARRTKGGSALLAKGARGGLAATPAALALALRPPPRASSEENP